MNNVYVYINVVQYKIMCYYKLCVVCSHYAYKINEAGIALCKLHMVGDDSYI